MQLTKNIFSGIAHLLYPRLCEGCSKPLLSAEEVLCLSCSMHMPLTGYHHIADNETAMRFAGRIPFQHATSLAYFTAEGLLQHLLHGLKYRSKKDIGIYLGALLGQELLQTNWIDDIDAVVPVPLHTKKEASRGYDQALLIAEGLANVIHKPVLTKAIMRVRHTETQTKKTREERVDNMRDAFVVRKKDVLTFKHLLLIDDVLTTGATLEACASALLSVPGVKISMATVGIAI